MTTDRLRAANKLNALRSTGPITERGRAAVRANAFKHGFYARVAHTYLADPVDMQELLDDFMADYQPVGAAETELVHRIVRDLHKSRRMEEGMTAYLALWADRTMAYNDVVLPGDPEKAAYALADRFATEFWQFKSVCPYERLELLVHRLRRAVDKSTQLLRDLQLERNASALWRIQNPGLADALQARFAPAAPSSAAASDLVDPASRFTPVSVDPASSLAPDSVSSVDPASRLSPNFADPTPPLVTSDSEPAHDPRAQETKRPGGTKTKSKENVTPPAPSEQTPNPEIGFVPHKPVSTSPTPPRKPRKAA
jgi:hypothetical protein